MKALFFLPHSKQAAGARYRVHQFLPALTAAGVTCDVREFVTPELYRNLYRRGRALEKSYWIARQSLRRFHDVLDARDADVVFVYRECYPFGPPFIESALRRLGKPIVYDFDDAIFLPEPTLLRNLLRNPAKTARIAQLADCVIVSNEHLRGFASAYNRQVEVIPTCVDTDVFTPAPQRRVGQRLRLGWIGSHSTAKYLEQLRPVLSDLGGKFDFELLVIGAGRDFQLPGVKVLNERWALETEVERFQSLDIGLYPLDNTVWELGKAGFKAIQYMAVGAPCVVSRVGVTRDIVTDGENGFLASTPREWSEKLGQLLSDAVLRQRLAAAGRRTIVERYSLSVNAPRLRSVLARVAASAHAATAPSNEIRT
jgi:glycosyltransferase involved in cell wall biosynthesis